MNIVETNNDYTGNLEFQQIWPSFIPVDSLPEKPPALPKTYTSSWNKDLSETLTFTLMKETPNETYPYLEYRKNLQLVKCYRQGKTWAFPNEMDIRNLIFPSITQDREYCPIFTDGKNEIPYTSLNPIANLKDCTFETTLDLDKLFISGWFYKGKKLSERLESFEMPFDDSKWLLKGNEGLARFKVFPGEKNVYQLPPNETKPETVVDLDNMLVTNKNINVVLNKIGHLDEGEYW